ncbi:MAG: Calx-beta domain-containing protein, partial [Pseudohongiellaceae bacterium]
VTEGDTLNIVVVADPNQPTTYSSEVAVTQSRQFIPAGRFDVENHIAFNNSGAVSSMITVSVTLDDDGVAGTGGGTIVLTIPAISIVSFDGWAVGTPSTITITVADADGVPPLPVVALHITDTSDMDITEITEGDSIRMFVTSEANVAANLAVSVSGGGGATAAIFDTANLPAGVACEQPPIANPPTTCRADLTIAAGAMTSQTVTIPTVNNTDSDADTSTTFAITDTDALTLGTPSSISVDVRNRAVVALPTLSITADKTEVTEAPDTTVVFTVTSTVPPTAEQAVFVRQSGEGSWLIPPDQGDRDITIPMNETMGHFTATIDDDNNDEPDGTIVYTMDPLPGYALNPDATSVTVKVTDNDDAPAVAVPAITLTATDTSDMAITEVPEGGVIRFVVTSDIMPSADLTILLRIGQPGFAPTSPPNGVDCMPISGVPGVYECETLITIPSTGTTGTFDLQLVDNSDNDGDVMVNYTLDFIGSTYTIVDPGFVTVTHIEDDAPVGTDPVVVFARNVVTIVSDPTTRTVIVPLTAITVIEGDGAFAGFTVTLSRAPGMNMTATVDYATAEGTAVSGGTEPDFQSLNGTLTFADMETEKTFNLIVINDVFYEVPEQLTLSLSNPTGLSLGTATMATITLIDEEEVMVQLMAGGTTATATEGEAGAMLEFEVSLFSGNLRTAVTVNYTLGGTAGAGDYTAPSGSLTLNQSISAITVAVAVTDDDNIYEAAAKTVIPTLDSASLPTRVSIVTGRASATLSIIDDEEPALSIAPGTTSIVTEMDGAVLSFEVSFTGADSVQDDLPVAYSIGGTATAGDDYEALSGSLTFNSADGNNLTVFVTVLD